MKLLLYTSVSILFAAFTTINTRAEISSENSSLNTLFIYCTSDVTSDTDEGMCSSVVFYESPIAIDTLGVTVVQTEGLPSGSVFPKGETFNRYVATDTLGNSSECTFFVFVNDNETPSLYCGQDITVQAEPGSIGAIVQDIAPADFWDNCQVAAIDYFIQGDTQGDGSQDASGTMFNIGISYVWYIVSDDNGNMMECGFQVEVVESNVFEVTCPGNITMNSSPDICGAYVNDIFPDINASSSNVVVAYEITGDTSGEGIDASGNLFNTGTSTIIYSISDDMGNATTCESTITIVDEVSPEIMCQDISVTLNSDGIAIVYADDLLSVITDNCGIAEYYSDNMEFNDTYIGENQVTVTAMDYSGNTSTCIAIVTVEENGNIDDTVIADLDFDVYPNPTLGDVTIDLPRERPGFYGRVLDFTGKLIYEFNFEDESKIKFSMDELEAGIYTITVYNEFRSVTKQVVKTK